MEDIEIISLLRTHRRIILYLTLGIGSLVAFGTAWRYWRQARTTVVSLPFRPAFSSAAKGLYPNGTPFGPNDVIATSVLDTVYATNELKPQCARDAFAHGFFVDQGSVEYDSLDAEYAGRLSDRALNAAERQRILEEYRLKRSAVPVNFRLGFMQAACPSVPVPVLRKVLGDVLSTWADESQKLRGVLSLPVSLLTPDSLDGSGASGVPRIVRIDQVRGVLNQMLAAVAALRKLPGADQVRLSGGTTSLADLEARLLTLNRARLEPIIVRAGASLGGDSLRWAEAALSSAEAAQKTAEDRVQSYVLALREFSAGAGTVAARTDGGRGAGREPGLTAQIDRSFIDRVLEMSQDITTYRQELTNAMVQESFKAIDAGREVSYHRRLVASLRDTRTSMTPQEVDRDVNEAVAEGKALIKQVNDLYGEFSRVALRPAAGLYTTESSGRLTVEESFTARTAWIIAITGFFAAFALMIGGVVLYAWAIARLPRFR